MKAVGRFFDNKNYSKYSGAIIVISGRFAPICGAFGDSFLG